MKKLKKSWLVISMICLAFVISGCVQGAAAAYKAGTYTGKSDLGHGGSVQAEVTVSETEIEKIVVDASGETGAIGEGAVEQLTNEIIQSQSLAVDVVSGASESSNAILDAVTDALKQAGADIDALKDPENKIEIVEAPQEDLDVDVVIVGAGGAGMAAAVEAKEAGKEVVIIEKMPIVGGNTNRATGGMNASETYIQKEQGIEDSNDVFYADTLKGGKDLNDPDLLHTMVEHSADALKWVNDLGADLTKVSFSGGATNQRIHQPADGSPVGPVVVDVLSKKLKELEVPILLNTKAEKLILDQEKVTGVEATDANGHPFKIHADAVILSTGGFGANHEMVEKYNPDLKGFATTNHSGATGDGITMAQEVGADLMQIDQIQIHPTTDPDTGYLFTEGLRGDGAVLVNKEGKRFTNELLTRDVVSQNILKQTDGIAYLITNEAMKEENASLAGYIEDGYALKGDSVAELAEAMEADEESLTKTMKDYTSAVEKGVDEEFDRAANTMVQSLAEGPYYAIPVTPSIHHTMGGLKIDPDTRVLSEDGKAIPGLYAAGELVGGVHGGNRIGGNAVLDIIVFGRIAGQTAAEEIE